MTKHMPSVAERTGGGNCQLSTYVVDGLGVVRWAHLGQIDESRAKEILGAVAKL